jgi:hypothetical protein
VKTLRRALGVAGSVLLGGAVAWAPIAAFTGNMLWVTKAGLAGLGLLLVMWLLPRGDVGRDDRADPAERVDRPPPQGEDSITKS